MGSAGDRVQLEQCLVVSLLHAANHRVAVGGAFSDMNAETLLALFETILYLPLLAHQGLIAVCLGDGLIGLVDISRLEQLMVEGARVGIDGAQHQPRRDSIQSMHRLQRLYPGALAKSLLQANTFKLARTANLSSIIGRLTIKPPSPPRESLSWV